MQAGCSSLRVAVIPSAIDPSRYSLESARFEHGKKKVIGMIGAFTSQKGHGVFFNALSILKKTMPDDWSALVVGDGPLMSECKRKVQTEGLDSRVTFMGFVESPKVLPFIDVLVVPSVDGEGSSGVIKEGWV